MIDLPTESNNHKEWQLGLFKKHPILFQENTLPPSETCMCWGIDVQLGWYDLIEELCEQLQNIMNDNPGTQIIARQVKEKFACLHFYYDTSFPNDMPQDMADTLDSQIQKIICAYEEKSMTICEHCGAKGARMRPGGWKTTLCNQCEEKRMAGVSP